jgi:CRP/FNR family transcriptional regulator, cyclic AMP receptor protein
MMARSTRSLDVPWPVMDGVATIADYKRAEIIFAQGEPSRSVLYIKRGLVQLSVRSRRGREAVVARLGPGEFFGEACLSGQRLRVSSATATASSTIASVARTKMAHLLRTEHRVSSRFIACMLGRNTRAEEDLLMQLFHSTETRLASALLVLAGYGTERPLRKLPKIPPGRLAQLAGTSPARVAALMAGFKRRGFIESNGGVAVHRSLLSVVLQD